LQILFFLFPFVLALTIQKASCFSTAGSFYNKIFGFLLFRLS
jgi:hypothetical protein